MTTELLEIQPRELRFAFELKKQSSCSVQIANKSDQYVAFKVKTTSPKKYCVRPNIGIIKPKATCDFAVTMQAQKAAPPDLLCKDKFLIQCTVVPFGTTEEDITSDMFLKDGGNYVEEKKLRVVLANPCQSPVLLPNNGELKKESLHESSLNRDITLNGIENIPPPYKSSEVVSDFETAKNVVTSEVTTESDAESRPAENSVEVQSDKDISELKLVNEFEGLKSKLAEMDSKLKEADVTIMKLNEERSMAFREKNMLKQELELLRKKKTNMRRVQVGFPLLYVCMIALISLATGYFIHK